MRRYVSRSVALSAALLWAGGCAAPKQQQDEGLKSGGGHSSMSLSSGGSIAPEPDRNLPRKAPQLVIMLDLYDIAVPVGSVSGNDEFWKRVDEDRVDVAAHDLLLKNGVRFGIAHDREWSYFKGLLAAHPEAQSTRRSSEAGKEGYVELTMRTAVAEQNLFGIDDKGVDWGRRFEKCDDLLGISFILSTHNVGETTVKACPIVRGLRETYNVSVLNNEQTQIEPRHIDHLYDMRLEAAIPMNDFLIIAPSKEAATLSTSLGATFLFTDGQAAPLEHVLIAVPRTFRSDEPPPSMMGR
jgi:hypothetical protein